MVFMFIFIAFLIDMSYNLFTSIGMRQRNERTGTEHKAFNLHGAHRAKVVTANADSRMRAQASRTRLMAVDST